LILAKLHRSRMRTYSPEPSGLATLLGYIKRLKNCPSNSSEFQQMKRFKAFWKDTGWLWTVFFVVIVGLMTFVSRVFVAAVPLLMVIFIYFALVRYDEEGNFIGA